MPLLGYTLSLTHYDILADILHQCFVFLLVPFDIPQMDHHAIRLKHLGVLHDAQKAVKFSSL